MSSREDISSSNDIPGFFILKNFTVVDSLAKFLRRHKVVLCARPGCGKKVYGLCSGRVGEVRGGVIDKIVLIISPLLFPFVFPCVFVLFCDTLLLLFVVTAICCVFSLDASADCVAFFPSTP